jgi:hypothetical protein
MKTGVFQQVVHVNVLDRKNVDLSLPSMASEVNNKETVINLSNVQSKGISQRGERQVSITNYSIFLIPS